MQDEEKVPQGQDEAVGEVGVAPEGTGQAPQVDENNDTEASAEESNGDQSEGENTGLNSDVPSEGSESESAE